MSNKSIILPDGSKLEWLNKDYSTFLNKSTILYGLSGTGKSSIIINILYALRNHISSAFIITKSSASADHNYARRVPKGCIRKSLTKEWLEEFITKQTERTKIYNCVNKLENLKAVFDMINNKVAYVLETGIINDAENRMKIVELNQDIPYPKKKQLYDGIKKARDEALTVLYKKFIRAYKVELENMTPELSKKYKLVINFLDFMPHSLLVFDDCAFMIKKWMKESPSIKELFYQGRHVYTTIVLATQSDKELESEIRKNAAISIFTTAQDATAAFGRGSNSFPERDRKKAQLCCDAVFTPDGVASPNNFQKLVYVRHDAINPFRYTIADTFDDDDFKIGAKCIWDLNDLLYPQDDSKLYDNIIYEKYADI